MDVHDPLGYCVCLTMRGRGRILKIYGIRGFPMRIMNDPLQPKQIVEGPAVAVDTAIFSVIEGVLKVLLIQIAQGPYAGQWALPGGLVGLDESLEETAERILSDKAGVQGIYLEQLATFGDIDRDVRGRSVSVAYFSLVSSAAFHPKTTEYYQDIQWHPVHHLPEMAFDHAKIVAYGRDRLANKLAYSNIAYALLPKEFTLAELQSLYEAIIGHALDKRNFWKKIQVIGLVKETGHLRQAGAGRPAKLYVFLKRTLESMDVL